MRKIHKFALIGAAMLGLAAPARADAPKDPLETMFAWWDEAFKTPGAYTQEAFERFFTEDATLTLNGKVAIRGTAEWAKHFQAIQGRGGIVEIVVPFKHAFRSGDMLYTYHIIRSRRNEGLPMCMLAAGHAVMRGDKIASITLVRHPLDPAKGETDPACWTE